SLAVLFLQTSGAAEHAAKIAHILAHNDHVGIALQHHVEGIVDRLDHVEPASAGIAFNFPDLLRSVHGRLPSGHLISRSRIACALCSLRCQGSSSNTSSTVVRNGWCSP